MKSYVKPAMELVTFQAEEAVMAGSVTGAAFWGVFGNTDIDLELN